jgi:hypothetical protein
MMKQIVERKDKLTKINLEIQVFKKQVSSFVKKIT